MADNEEEVKPVIRKTWIMLKKAGIEQTFNTNIIPKFENGEGITTAKDNFGEWKIWADCYSGCYIAPSAPNLSAIFDHDDETYSGVRTGGYAKSYAWFYLELPNRTSIRPTSIRFTAEGNWQQKFYVQGYNPLTEAWETITNTVYPSMYGGSGVQDKATNLFAVTDAAKQTFYTKFRMHFHDQYVGSQTEHYIWAFEIIEGTIKKS